MPRVGAGLGGVARVAGALGPVGLVAGGAIGVAAFVAALNKWSDSRLKSLLTNAQGLSASAAGILMQQNFAKMSRDFRRMESVSEQAQRLSAAMIQRDEAFLPIQQKMDEIAISIQFGLVKATTSLVELVTDMLRELGLLNEKDTSSIDLLKSLNTMLQRSQFDTGIRTPPQPIPNLMRQLP